MAKIPMQLVLLVWRILRVEFHFEFVVRVHIVIVVILDFGRCFAQEVIWASLVAGKLTSCLILVVSELSI